MYSDFAGVYDRLMADADYKTRTAVVMSLFNRFDRKPKLLLDLACGTGRFSREFARQAVSVIGVDISPEMLGIAKEKSEGLDILYLCQDACELDLYGTVDGAISCLDSLNHLENYKDFQKALKRVSLFLEPNRLFIFDLNTPYKHKTVLGNNIFIKDTEDIYCVWQNEYEKKDNAVNIDLDFFVRSDGAYIRGTESIREIAFSNFAVKRAIKKAGLRLEAVLDGDTGEKINSKTERNIYVTRKIDRNI